MVLVSDTTLGQAQQTTTNTHRKPSSSVNNVQAYQQPICTNL